MCWLVIARPCASFLFQLPAVESGTAAGAPVKADDTSGFARPLAPPEVGPPVSDGEQEEEEEEEESDLDGQEEEADEALVEAVEKLLREVEVRREKKKARR